MPNKTKPKSESTHLFLLVTSEQASKRIAEQVTKGHELKQRHIPSQQDFDSVQQEYWTWSEYNTELLRRLFTNNELAEEYRGISIGFIGGRELSLHKKIEELHEDIDHKIRRLESIKARLELIPLDDPVLRQVENSSTPYVDIKKVFVVHGHDELTRETIARYLEKLNLQPIILHEQVSGGRTIIEKLEHHADAGFAVVLLTPDDIGAARDASDGLQSRARQNVILELGYFLGKLGRSRVCTLYKGILEFPSDYMGVIYVPLDESGGWKLLLARELKAAGFSIDMNKVL